MLNQVAVEAIYSATYLENYLDSVENLPNDLQRNISRMRQLDVDFQGAPTMIISLIFSTNFYFFFSCPYCNSYFTRSRALSRTFAKGT